MKICEKYMKNINKPIINDVKHFNLSNNLSFDNYMF